MDPRVHSFPFFFQGSCRRPEAPHLLVDPHGRDRVALSAERGTQGSEGRTAPANAERVEHNGVPGC